MLNLFGRSSEAAEKAKPAGLTFEERAETIARLIEAKYGVHKDAAWLGSVRSLLSGTPVLSGLSKPLDQLTPPLGPAEVELVVQTIDAALRLIERHPIAAFGPDTKGLLNKFVDDAVTDSSLARVLKIAGPFLVAAIFGGTIWGGVTLRGLETKKAEIEKEISAVETGLGTAKQNLKNLEERVEAVATAQLNRIMTAGDAAEAQFKKVLNADAEGKLAGYAVVVNGLVEKARSDAKTLFDRNAKLLFEVEDAAVNSALMAVFESNMAKTTDGQHEIDSKMESLKQSIQNKLNEVEAPSQIRDFKEELRKLKDRIEGLAGIANEASSLRRLLDSTGTGTRLTVSQLLWVLTVKDFIAVLAIVLSIVASGFAVITWRSRSVG
jgi:hypothetical protein